MENRRFQITSRLAREAKKYILSKFSVPYRSADLIVGYRADDSYFSFAGDFLNGTISLSQLEEAMFLGRLGEQFEKGNPRFVAGMSGTELADQVFCRVTGRGCNVEPKPYYDRSDAYWTGYTLAWYQWKSNCSFKELFAEIPCSSIAAMNWKYHEMDPEHAADEISRIRRLSAYAEYPALKRLRQQAGMSQRELAETANVPVRTIQQYEQRQKDIRKASYDTVSRLAGALHCSTEQCVGRN